MEKFGIYQILQALGRLNASQNAEKAPSAAPATGDGNAAPSSAAPIEKQADPPRPSILPPPSYFNQRMLEIMNRHDEVSRRIDQKYGKR